MLQRILQSGSGGGSEKVEINFQNAGTGSQYQAFTAEIGKRYLVISFRSTATSVSNAGIESGATVDKVLINNLKNSPNTATVYIAEVTATATTVKMLGSANVAVYAEITW